MGGRTCKSVNHVCLFLQISFICDSNDWYYLNIAFPSVSVRCWAEISSTTMTTTIQRKKCISQPTMIFFSYWIYYRFNADWLCCFCALGCFVYFRACSRSHRLVVSARALLEFRVTMLFFFYCLYTVNKNNWFVVAPTFFLCFAFLLIVHFFINCTQSMMHLIINTLRKTYVANFHPLLLSPLIHLSRASCLPLASTRRFSSRWFPLTSSSFHFFSLSVSSLHWCYHGKLFLAQ